MSFYKNLGCLAVVAVSLIFVSQAHATSVEIFGVAQNGDFFDGDTPVFSGERWGGNRLTGDNSDPFFIGNWSIDNDGFGGVDQVRGSNMRHLMVNSGVTQTAIAYLNDGDDGGTPPTDGANTYPAGSGNGNQNDGDDTDPFGAFPQVFMPGNTISYSLRAIDNTDGGSFDFEIALLFDGETDLNNRVTIVSETVVGPAGSSMMPTFVPLAGTSTASIPSATSFNVVAIIDNSNGGNDQVGIDDIVLTLNQIPEPGTFGLAAVCGVLGLIGRRRNS